jgi:DinB superfamily
MRRLFLIGRSGQELESQLERERPTALARRVPEARSTGGILPFSSFVGIPRLESAMSTFAALIEQYAKGPEILRKCVAGMSREHLTAKPVAGKWSTLDCVAHIADFEPILADRMMRVISHERPLLLVADENLFLQTLNYDGRDLEEELACIETLRKKMVRILKSLPAETEKRMGVHSFKGLISVEGVLTAAVNHIPHHVVFIEEKRKALGI